MPVQLRKGKPFKDFPRAFTQRMAFASKTTTWHEHDFLPWKTKGGLAGDNRGFVLGQLLELREISHPIPFEEVNKKPPDEPAAE